MSDIFRPEFDAQSAERHTEILGALHEAAETGRLSEVAAYIVSLEAQRDTFQNLAASNFGRTVRILEKQHQEELAARDQIIGTDSKTGLLNDVGIGRKYEELRTQSHRRTSDTSVVMFLDLDKFKEANDTYGHAFGDKVLFTVASLFRVTTRPDDILARYGGDEFVIILPSTDLESGLHVAERLRTAVSIIEGIDDKPLELGVSIGVDMLDFNKPTFEEAILPADEAMYKAKSLGKNRVELADRISGANEAPEG